MIIMCIVIKHCIFDLTGLRGSNQHAVYLLFTVFQNEKTQILTTFLWLRLVSSTETFNRLSVDVTQSDANVSSAGKHGRNTFYLYVGSLTVHYS